MSAVLSVLMMLSSGGVPSAECRNCFGQQNFAEAYSGNGSVIKVLTNSTGFVDCCATCEIDFKGVCGGWNFDLQPNGNTTCVLYKGVEGMKIISSSTSVCGVPPNQTSLPQGC
eukprot:TRINITY_DN23121_c0_g1_i1.p1 TRINITY_DN23121_c0_g1~~TRINITY_DN23121_c0_g1_i1.p1  ORF type:complete len:113 (+),score=22.49 TRINITY_DN23121_c0_g1_i1:50-388(+)